MLRLAAWFFIAFGLILALLVAFEPVKPEKKLPPASRRNAMPISEQEFIAAGPLKAVGGGGNQFETTTEYESDKGQRYFETLYLENGIVVSVTYLKVVE